MYQPEILSRIRSICDQFILWQAPSGGINIETCPYHRPPLMVKVNSWNQDLPWVVRALYATYDLTAEKKYKSSADAYSVYCIAAMYPKQPAFALGGTIEPVYKLYREHNPLDDTFDAKITAIYQWLLGYHTNNGNYIDCGYVWPKDATTDAAFSCDLTDVGRGLIAYAKMFDDPQALQHAVGLAQYFLNEAHPGTYDGLWNPSIGTFLIGPTPGAGFENLRVDANQSGWIWSSYYGTHWLARLYDCTSDQALKDRIQERCVCSLRWNFDACQFEDGSIGMAGRDDKWLGTTAMTVLEYWELYKRGMLNAEFQTQYYPLARQALDWLEAISASDSFPQDGYIPIHLKSRPEPGCNTIWLLASVVDALLCGPELRAIGL